MDKHIHAESVFQDSSQSIVTENSIYDFNRLSSHEIAVIITVLRNAYSDKYHSSLRGIGLMNEAYPITYKPRYILLEASYFLKIHITLMTLLLSQKHTETKVPLIVFRL